MLAEILSGPKVAITMIINLENGIKSKLKPLKNTEKGLLMLLDKKMQTKLKTAKYQLPIQPLNLLLREKPWKN